MRCAAEPMNDSGEVCFSHDVSLNAFCRVTARRRWVHKARKPSGPRAHGGPIERKEGERRRDAPQAELLRTSVFCLPPYPSHTCLVRVRLTAPVLRLRAVAIAEIQRTAVDGRATRVFRLGEWVPFILVHKSGGATGSKQFENVAAPDDVILFGIPVNLHLIYTNRLLPALFGQVRCVGEPVGGMIARG